MFPHSPPLTAGATDRPSARTLSCMTSGSETSWLLSSSLQRDRARTSCGMSMWHFCGGLEWMGSPAFPAHLADAAACADEGLRIHAWSLLSLIPGRRDMYLQYWVAKHTLVSKALR